MSVVVSPGRARGRLRRAPELRLLHSSKDTTGRAQDAPRPSEDRPALRVVDGPSRVVVAGADASRRAVLLEELAETLPASTVFEQAGEVWEVLEHAPASRMVIFAGDLDDTPAESLMHMLGHRHPELPIFSMGGPVQGAGRHDAGRLDDLRRHA